MDKHTPTFEDVDGWTRWVCSCGKRASSLIINKAKAESSHKAHRTAAVKRNA